LFDTFKEVEMNIKRIALVLVLGLLVLISACNEATELAAENNYIKSFDNAIHGEITFEPGDKCTLKVNQGALIDEGTLKILVKDDTYENYMIAVSTMDEGYTLEDLQNYESATVPPLYTQLNAFYVLPPGSATIIADFTTIDEGELYFTCQVQGSNIKKNIDSLGPLVITGE
jgi:hypothetical protein